MKYMGSKRAMLKNGLGVLLTEQAKNCDRIVDLFCGAASVSWFAAQNLNRPILAVDLQAYAVVMARAIIERTSVIDKNIKENSWINIVEQKRKNNAYWDEARKLDEAKINIATWSKRARELCKTVRLRKSPIWNAYGGYYYSPTQALTIDAMLACLPKNEPHRSTFLASIIIVASRCAASPGHTAQPFKANHTAGKYLREAWKRDPIKYAEEALNRLSKMHAKKKGSAIVADAVEEAAKLSKNDLVFVDPPYSGVHYSRFYHVLETIARGKGIQVAGAGRYPPPKERPTSAFSRKTESNIALDTLIENLAASGATVIFTFPAGESSNGLSGLHVENAAKKWFAIEKKTVKTRFSTLGGNNLHRYARKVSKELILLMKPKKSILRART